MLAFCETNFSFPQSYYIWQLFTIGYNCPKVSNGLSPPIEYFTDHSKVLLLLWINAVIFVLCLLCFRVCSMLPCSHLKGKGWPLGSCLWCYCVTIPFGILGQMWYSIVSVPDPCCLSYYEQENHNHTLQTNPQSSKEESQLNTFSKTIKAKQPAFSSSSKRL